MIRKYNFRNKRCLEPNKNLPNESRMQPAESPAQNPTQVTTGVIEIRGSNIRLDMTGLNINSTAQERQFDSSGNDFKEASLVDSTRCYT
jgi:hypothetical protein